MAKKQKKVDYVKELKESFDRWDHIYKYGCNDPFWEDGMNLWLVGNHINNYKRHIEETMKPEEYPEIYFRENPPEVDKDYIAQPDIIRKVALQTLEIFNQDENLKFLKEHIHYMSKQEIKDTCIDNVIGYSIGLEHAIKEDDLVSMRRYTSQQEDNTRIADKSYLKSFADCSERVRNLQPPKITKAVQLSLFAC